MRSAIHMAFALTIVRNADEPDGPKGGRRAFSPLAVLARWKVPAGRALRPHFA